MNLSDIIISASIWTFLLFAFHLDVFRLCCSRFYFSSRYTEIFQPIVKHSKHEMTICFVMMLVEKRRILCVEEKFYCNSQSSYIRSSKYFHFWIVNHCYSCVFLRICSLSKRCIQKALVSWSQTAQNTQTHTIAHRKANRNWITKNQLQFEVLISLSWFVRIFGCKYFLNC